jgi:hypothetical protein
MLKHIKGVLKSSTPLDPGPPVGPHTLQEARFALAVLSDISGTVAFVIPGLKESVDRAIQVIRVVQVCDTHVA